MAYDCTDEARPALAQDDTAMPDASLQFTDDQLHALAQSDAGYLDRQIVQSLAARLLATRRTLRSVLGQPLAQPHSTT